MPMDQKTILCIHPAIFHYCGLYGLTINKSKFNK